MELYRAHRPQTLDGIVGQDAAVADLKALVAKGKVPHAVMFAGGSGTGKTTMARALARALGCGDKNINLAEMDTADVRGIDAIRDIRERLKYPAINRKNRVWILDEAQKITSDAQACLLKTLEEAAKDTYFFLCTTDPEKVLRTVRGRCLMVRLAALKEPTLAKLAADVAKREGHPVKDSVANKIAELADGSAREALILLESVIEKEHAKQLEHLENQGTKTEAIALCRALMGRTSWKEVAGILGKLDKEEPEKLRRMVLGYCRKALLSGNGKAYAIIQSFRDHVFDSGHAGLAANCWEILGNK